MVIGSSSVPDGWGAERLTPARMFGWEQSKERAASSPGGDCCSAAADHGDRLALGDGWRGNDVENLTVEWRRDLFERAAVEIGDPPDPRALRHGVAALDLGIKD